MLTALRRNLSLEALDLFKKQLQWGFVGNIDQVTVAIVLKACCGDSKLGCQIHAFAISSGFISHVTVPNSLMNMYCKAGLFDRALVVFENLNNPDIVSWNTVLSGFQRSDDALNFALRMNFTGVAFDAVTCTTVLAFCSDHEGFIFGFQLHSRILKCGLDCEVFVGNALITMYSRCCRLVEARRVFDEMRNKDLVSWNAMLSGYAQEGNSGLEAILVFLEMLKEGMKLDHVSFTGAISACGHGKEFELGRQIHSLAVKIGYDTHVKVCNVLISTYSKCEDIEDAKLVFESIIDRNVVSWTTMISISEEDATSLFNEMRRDGVYPNDVTFVGLIHAITMKNLVEEGQMIHGVCVKTSFLSELNVSNSLITMYAKFESMSDSMKVFEELNYREIISWNSLISGYAQNGLWQEALQTFLSALMESRPNEFTFGSVLSSIASAEAISMRHGQRCHSHILKLGLNTNPIVSSALLDMYAKRGSICESLGVFSETPLKNEVAWTAIISAHARHGDYEAVMNLFKDMEREGVKPDSITFLAVITACGRKGMVDTGYQLFNSMVKDHLIEPSPEHYSSMVDMLGRAGRLKEAEEFVGQIPGGAGLSVLQSLLGACRIHGNVDMAKRVADDLIEMEPMGSGSYVLMSNLYAEKGEWEKVAKIRKG
ncbi:Pentatricopeptide repeat-containing protein, mitochondrial [Vitis vinifera]|nr:Pentatricopeptide repeat-containing protein, mitochondrial [Vitis vinifera]